MKLAAMNVHKNLSTRYVYMNNTEAGRNIVANSIVASTVLVLP